MITINVPRAVQFLIGLVAFAVFATLTVASNILLLAQLLGVARMHLFPEELFGLWGMSLVCALLLVYLFSKKVWRYL